MGGSRLGGESAKGQERLEWFLVTNQPVLSFEDAYRVVGWYECRWIIEEYHKGLKTGCKIESPQFTAEERLKPAIALLSIVTLTEVRGVFRTVQLLISEGREKRPARPFKGLARTLSCDPGLVTV